MSGAKRLFEGLLEQADVWVGVLLCCSQCSGRVPATTLSDTDINPGSCEGCGGKLYEVARIGPPAVRAVAAARLVEHLHPELVANMANGIAKMAKTDETTEREPRGTD